MSDPIPLQALIFDVDGTLADTEDAHRAAFNQAFADMGLGWHWDEARYAELLAISGGRERVRHHWRQACPDVKALDAQAAHDTVERIHELKSAYYEATVLSGAIALRPGVLALIEEALAADLCLALVTSSSPVNAAVLLRRAIGPHWRHCFTAIGDAGGAALKKPDPQVYRRLLRALALDARAGLALEDSGKGLTAATRAGLATVVTPTQHTRQQDFGGALRVLPDLAGIRLADLRRWHREHWVGARRERLACAA